MATKVRIELNRTGIRQILNSAEVRGRIAAKTEAVANAARGNLGGDDLKVVTEVAGRSRARGYVTLVAGAAKEAEDRVLGRAMDAARGA